MVQNRGACWVRCPHALDDLFVYNSPSNSSATPSASNQISVDDMLLEVTYVPTTHWFTSQMTSERFVHLIFYVSFVSLD